MIKITVMDLPFISCIVPVYKVENYLPKCIESIQNQTYRNFELILIEDGSPDFSGQICEEYAQKDDRIRVFHLENGGVSKARNYGLTQARGEWVTFIDSDDYVLPCFFENLLGPVCSLREEIDFVHAGYIYGKNGDCHIGQSYADKYYSSKDMDAIFLLFRGLVVSKLWRRRIIAANDIRFDERMKIAEDLCFTIDYLIHVRGASFCSACDYVYMFRADSATQKQNFDAEFLYYGFKHQLSSMQKAIDLFGFSDAVVQYRMGQIALVLLNYICYLYKHATSYTFARQRISRIPSNEMSVLKYCPRQGARYWVSVLLRKECLSVTDFLLRAIYNLKGKRNDE